MFLRKQPLRDCTNNSSFKDTLQTFSVDFKQRCIPFWNFQNNFFTETLSVTAYDSSAGVLYQRLA